MDTKADLDPWAWLRTTHGAVVPDAVWQAQQPVAVGDLKDLLPQAPREFAEQTAALTETMRDHGGYERYIEATGAIPTRADNWHDYYNALCWHLFPHSKEALHQSQMAFPADATAKNGRSPQQNGATLFDENGIVIVTEKSWVTDLLRDHQWETVFVERREELLTSARFWILGHAMWEQLRQPFIGLTAKWLHVSLPPESPLATVDRALSTVPPPIPRELGNVPILGWPGICAVNQDPIFYQDQDYFRPKRR